MKKITSNQKINRPFPISLLNFFGKQLERLNIKSNLDLDALFKAAQKETGLQDFGDDTFREPLQILLDSIEKEANLHTLGRIISKIRFKEILKQRLLSEYCFQQFPEILEEDLKPPIIITGLQRTGTTKLQRLLAADPNSLSVFSWEALHPAPVISKKIIAKGNLQKENLLNIQNKKQRIAKGKTAEKGAQFLAPDFFSIHPVEHDAPEEEVLLLDQSFISTVPEAMMQVPTYANWIEQTDHRPAYNYLKKMLQFLQWQKQQSNATHWVLKTPHHLEFLENVFAIFPKAKIIWTHRDPLQTAPSFSNMIFHSHLMFSDEVTRNQVAKHWLRKCGRMVDRGMAFRAQFGEERFLDVSYQDLLKNPLKEVEKIYEFAELDFSEKSKEGIKKSLQHNRQHKYGVHKYKLEDFHLNPEIINEQFKNYLNHFQKKLK